MIINDVLNTEKKRLESIILAGTRLPIRIDRYGGAQASGRDINKAVGVLAYDTQNGNADGKKHFVRLNLSVYVFVPNSTNIQNGTINDGNLVDVMTALGYELGVAPFYNDSLQAQYTFTKQMLIIPDQFDF